MYGQLLYKYREQNQWTIEQFCATLAKASEHFATQLSLKKQFKPPSKSVVSQYERGISIPKADIAILLSLVSQDLRIISEHPRAKEFIPRWMEWTRQQQDEKGRIPKESAIVIEGCAAYVYQHASDSDYNEFLGTQVYDLSSDVITSRLLEDMYIKPWYVHGGKWVLHAVELAARTMGSASNTYAKLLFLRGIWYRTQHDYQQALQDFSLAETVFESNPVRSYQKNYWAVELQLHRAITNLECGQPVEAFETERRLRQLCKTPLERANIFASYFWALGTYYAFHLEFEHALKASRIAVKFADRCRNMGYRWSDNGYLNICVGLVYLGVELLDRDAVMLGLDRIYKERARSKFAESMYWRSVAIVYSVTGRSMEHLSRAILNSSSRDDERALARVEELFAKWHLLRGEVRAAQEWIDQITESSSYEVVRSNLTLIRRHSFHWKRTCTPQRLFVNRQKLSDLVQKEQ